MAEFAFRSEPEFCAYLFCAAMPSRALWTYRRNVSVVLEAHAAVVGVEILPNLVAHLANPLIFHPSALNETGETGACS